MEPLRLIIEKQLYKLRNNLKSDFAAIALYSKKNNQIRWHYVSGSTNQRYQLMVIKPGQGLVGWAFRHGRSKAIHEALPEFKEIRLDSPIMIAEELQAAMVVPFAKETLYPAVLLIGEREKRIYNQHDILTINHMLSELSELIIQDQTN